MQPLYFKPKGTETKQMKKLVIAFLLIMLLSSAAFTAGGCNAPQGMGRDIERGGEEIQEAAD